MGKRTTDERFDAKWELDPDTGCHVWTGTTSGHGYGRFHRGDGSRKMVRAHVYAYERKYGPVPGGLELDHVVCSNPPCCNPDHVEPSTHRENSLRGVGVGAVNARKTHCPRGIPYDEAHTRWYRGRRYCRCDKPARRTSRAAES